MIHSKILKIILITILNSSFAVHADDVYELKKDDPAPIDGLLFSKEKAKQVRDGLIERDSVKEINISLTKSLELEKQNVQYANDKIKIYATSEEELAKALHDERTLSQWTKFGYIALGVAATLGAAWGMKQVAK